MKKILTLFVMLLCGWSIVSAQTPAFGYQMVVRNANNELMTGTPVSLTIYVMSGMEEIYSEQKTATTDDLGMLSVLVGTVSPADFAEIDWSIADTIRTIVNFSDEEFEYKTAIQAVPSALQAAKSKLTTDQIVAYLSDPQTNMEDYAQIMSALYNNIPTDGELWGMIKNRLVNYLKNRKDKAVDVAVAYLQQASPNDVGMLYNEVSNEVKEKIMNLAKQSALENKGYAMELVEAYLPTVTPEDVDDAYNHITSRINSLSAEDKADLREAFIQRAVPFAKNHLDLAVTAANYFLDNVTGDQVYGFLNTVFANSQMKVALVDTLFYNYLDYYLRPTIINRLNEGNYNGYLPKQHCGTDNHEVDFCSMKRVLGN